MIIAIVYFLIAFGAFLCTDGQGTVSVPDPPAANAGDGVTFTCTYTPAASEIVKSIDWFYTGASGSYLLIPGVGTTCTVFNTDAGYYGYIFTSTCDSTTNLFTLTIYGITEAELSTKNEWCCSLTVYPPPQPTGECGMLSQATTTTSTTTTTESPPSAYRYLWRRLQDILANLL